MGRFDADSLQDYDTAQTLSGQTIVFTTVKHSEGVIKAAIAGGRDTALFGSVSVESCAGPVYIVDAPLRPKEIAPALGPVQVPIPALQPQVAMSRHSHLM